MHRRGTLSRKFKKAKEAASLLQVRSGSDLLKSEKCVPCRLASPAGQDLIVLSASITRATDAILEVIAPRLLPRHHRSHRRRFDDREFELGDLHVITGMTAGPW